jgi:phenylacetate-CoA ligase
MAQHGNRTDSAPFYLTVGFAILYRELCNSIAVTDLEHPMNPFASPKNILASYQGRCLEALDTALNRTPMYNQWRLLDPGEGASIDERYSALPALSKSDIREHFPYGVVPRGLDLDAAIARGEVSFVQTSGTAEESLTNIWNQDWWNASERASWSLNANAAGVLTGTHREAILASGLSVGPRSEGPQIARDGRMLARFLFLNEYGSTAQWPEGHEDRIRMELEGYSPVVLEANPSLLSRFARWAWRNGKSVFQPRLITLTYEFPSALQLRDIRRVFSSPIASSYGATEAGYVFMECEKGRLHQNCDFCRVDLAPVRGLEKQGIGRILATTFANRWFPLLRFDIGDLARVSTDPCPCGRSFGLTLSAIEGRLISALLSSGNQIVTHRQLDQAVAAVNGIDEYRLDQELPNRARLRLMISEDRPKQSVLGDAREAVQSLLGNDMAITVEAVCSLLPEASGKFLLARRHFPLNIEGGVRMSGGSDDR